MRLFVGVPVPEELKPSLVQIQKRLRLYVNMKDVEPENFHWTIKFLGDVSETKIGDIKRVLEGLKSSIKPFSINLQGLGVFPAADRPNVLWVGLSDDKEFVGLLRRTDEALSQSGFPSETRGYEAHLTLGRVKSVTSIQKFKRYIATCKAELVGPMDVKVLVLYESTLSSDGPTYKKLHEVRL